MKKNQRSFDTILESIPKEKLENLYLNKLLSKEAISKELKICYSTVSKLIDYYSLNRDTCSVKSKASIRAHANYFDSLKSKFPYELVYNDYIVNNYRHSELQEKYHITSYALDRLIDAYDLHKSKKVSVKLGMQTKHSKYGNYNFNNWKKGFETRIENSGSLEESYKLGYEKYKETCLEKYGTECLFNSLYSKGIRKKRDTKPNLEFKQLLDDLDIQYTREYEIHSKSFDFNVNDILLEINPWITHNIDWNPYSSTHKGIAKDYHKIKSELATSNNFRCIHIWDWDDKNKIANSLINKTIIYARKCEIRIINKTDCDNFINKYHFQNSCKNQNICLGLYYNNELVQVMTFGKPRYNKTYQYELLRLCTNSSFKVVGGSNKLFKHFIDNYNPNSIISYCDLSKFKGDVYTDLRFKLKSVSSPTCHWYNPKLQIHITDNLLRQRGFDQLLGHIFGTFGKNTSNEQLMIENGFFRLYDCGQSTYIWKK